VVGLIISVALFGAIFVAKHPDPLNFATFATLIGTLTGFYHFMVIRDSKQADA